MCFFLYTGIDQVLELEKKCFKLQNQIQDMEVKRFIIV